MDDIVTKRYHLLVTNKDTVHPIGLPTEFGYVYPILNSVTGFAAGYDNYSTDVWSGTIHGSMIQVVLREGRAAELHRSFSGEKLFVTSEKPLDWFKLRAWDLPEGAVTPLRASIGTGPTVVPKVMTLTKADHWISMLKGMGLETTYLNRVFKLLATEPRFSNAYNMRKINDEIADLIEDSLSDQDEADELDEEEETLIEERLENKPSVKPEWLTFGCASGSEGDDLSSTDGSENEETLVSPSDGLLSAVPSITDVQHSEYCPSETVTISSGSSPLLALAKSLPRPEPDPHETHEELLVTFKVPRKFLKKLKKSGNSREEPFGGREAPTKKKKNRQTVLRTDVLSEEVLGRARKAMLVSHVVDPRGRTRASAGLGLSEDFR